MSATLSFCVSDRFSDVGFSEIVVIRNKILALKKEGHQIFQFEGGEPFPNTPQVIKDACLQALVENKTRYAPSSGIPELISVLTDKLNKKNHIPAEPNHLIVVAGGMHGLFAAFQAILNPGEEVLLFSPYWTPTKDLISMTGGKTVLVNTLKAHKEGITNTLKAYLTPQTRLLCLSSPQNPTGIVFSREEMLEIANFVKTHNLLVISDEAYEDLVYDQAHISIASFPDMYRRTISCFTFSKSYAMTGWRLGYVAAPEPFITAIKQSVLYSTNGVSTPTQWAGLAAVTQVTDFIEENLAEYRRRRDLLVNGLNELGFDCPMPGGAFYAFPSIKKFGKTSKEFAATLLAEAKIATVPGSVFGPEGEGHLRFSYSVAVETISSGLAALKDFCEKRI
ncbi:MAG: pyridoxal phosphate-dependent aminotransferase [Acidobacteria bacterium]|nr:pyridoxal phosphate-dependent aminotransferase [Acidobacteriota bacterium]